MSDRRPLLHGTTDALVSGFAADAARSPRFELEAVERNCRAAVDALSEVGVVDAGQRGADDAQFLDVPVGLRERDLAIGVALRRVVAILLQQLARLFTAAGTGRVQRDAAVQLVKTHLHCSHAPRPGASLCRELPGRRKSVLDYERTAAGYQR